MSKTPTQPRPWWVRFAVGRASTRKTALFTNFTIMGCNLLLLLFCIIGLLTASEALFGTIALVVALAATASEVILILWTWLAVRWMDRNGQWG